MTQRLSSPKYFFSLDAIRGFAALIVVMSHWQFFHYDNDTVSPASLANLGLPGYSYLAMMYELAPFVVDLFFLLSGFIFFWFYAEKIASRKTSFFYFLSFRFTRLYPVHLMALLALVVLQTVMFNLNGHHFIVQNNDTYHFVLHLFLIQTWGFESTPALNGFNGPSWSASVEVLLYLIFFLLCWFKQQKNIFLIAGIVVSGTLIQYIYPMIGQGMYSFFLGALLYYTYTWMAQRKNIKQLTIIVIILAVLIWTFAICEYVFSFTRSASMVWSQKLLPYKDAAFHTRLFDLVRNTFFRTIVNPVSLLALVLIETTYGSIKTKWITLLGNTSFAMYLMHFPLMLLFAIVTDISGISRNVLHSPYAMLLFFAILLPLSVVVRHYFELPVQQLLRKRLTERTPIAVKATTQQS